MKRFLLDTNVISEPMRPRPSAAVLRWFEARDPACLFLSAITLGELVAGIRRLESTARRRSLEKWLADVVVTQFHGRILSFDAEVAWRWGVLVAQAAAPDAHARRSICRSLLLPRTMGWCLRLAMRRILRDSISMSWTPWS